MAYNNIQDIVNKLIVENTIDQLIIYNPRQTPICLAGNYKFDVDVVLLGEDQQN